MTPKFLASNKDHFDIKTPIVITSKGLHVESQQLLSDAVVGEMVCMYVNDKMQIANVM